jgi:hypothetical protein
MNKLIPIAVLALFVTALFSSSCTKEIIKPVTVTDTVKIITNNIIGMDSVKADFVYTIKYQSTDSLGSVELHANTASFNVPSDAVYSWAYDGNKYTISNQNYLTLGLDYLYGANGPHILAMTITCPGLKKVFTVAKTFTVKLKG